MRYWSRQARGEEACPSSIVLARDIAAGKSDCHHWRIGAQLVGGIHRVAQLIIGRGSAPKGTLGQLGGGLALAKPSQRSEDDLRHPRIGLTYDILIRRSD